MSQSLIVLMENFSQHPDSFYAVENTGPDEYSVAMRADETLFDLNQRIREAVRYPRFTFMIFGSKFAASRLVSSGAYLEQFGAYIIERNLSSLAIVYGHVDERGTSRLKAVFSEPCSLQLPDMNKGDTNDDKDLAHHIHRIHRHHRRRIERITGNHSNRIQRITSYR